MTISSPAVVRRGRLSWRALPALLATALPALLATALLAACGSGGGDGSSSQDPALQASRPGELTAFVQERLRKLNANGQLGTTANVAGGDIRPVAGGIAAAPGAAATASQSRSSLLVQEEGVDEADLLRSTGTHLFTAQPTTGAGPTVGVYERASDGRANRLSSVVLPGDGALTVDTDGLHISADERTLAVVSTNWTAAGGIEVCPTCATLVPYWVRSSVTVQRVDVSNPAAAAAGERIQIDGALVDSRRIGDALYVVSTFRPALAAQFLPATATQADREAAIASLTAADLLPRMRRNGGAPEPLLSETDCYLQNANASTDVQFTTITVFDLRSATLARTSRCFVGGTEALYMSASALYLSTTRWSFPTDVVTLVFPNDIRTDIHKFTLEGGNVSYRGTGTVDGHLGWDRPKTSYRFSEHNGDLRVVTFTGSFGWIGPNDASTVAPSPARLTILRERSSDRTLQPVATLPNSTRPASLGKPGEQVYAVRFLGDRAYVVTFRRTDPLYVLDLSNPADPKTVGELEIAGFSEMLFPLAGGQLLGVGRDADSSGMVTGVKLAVFDVNNPAQPRQLSSVTLGSAGSISALSFARHGLAMQTVGSTVRLALPVNLASSGFAGYQHGLQQLEVAADGTLSNRGMAGGGQPGYGPVWQERGAMVGDNLYFLTNGNVETFSW